jgi:hypothetical protein
MAKKKLHKKRRIFSRRTLLLRDFKVRAKVSLCVSEHQTIKAYWVSEFVDHALLTSALDGGE